VAVLREDEADRELGDGDRVLPRAVRHPDAALRRGLHVDRVEARAGAHDEREASLLEHRARHLRGANDEDVGLRLSDRLGERVAIELGLVDDLAACILQSLAPR
jgi:hypothetical protein